jgi:hypothetical protein
LGDGGGRGGDRRIGPGVVAVAVLAATVLAATVLTTILTEEPDEVGARIALRGKQGKSHR